MLQWHNKKNAVLKVAQQIHFLPEYENNCGTSLCFWMADDKHLIMIKIPNYICFGIVIFSCKVMSEVYWYQCVSYLPLFQKRSALRDLTFFDVFEMLGNIIRMWLPTNSIIHWKGYTLHVVCPHPVRLTAIDWQRWQQEKWQSVVCNIIVHLLRSEYTIQR